MSGGKSQGNPTGGGEYHLFLAGNRAVLFGQPAFILAAGVNRMTIVVFEKRGFLSTVERLFDSTKVLNLRKNI